MKPLNEILFNFIHFNVFSVIVAQLGNVVCKEPKKAKDIFQEVKKNLLYIYPLSCSFLLVFKLTFVAF
jgi:hypothetical protein